MSGDAPGWRGGSDSVERTVAIGRSLGQLARAGDLIALMGELGAGKTQLVRGIAEGMGLDPDAVSSPTFVIMHEYEPVGRTARIAGGAATAADESDQPGPALVHIDAYRLDTLGDLESIGWNDHGRELRSNAVVVVEWADKLGDALGEDALEIRLSHAGDTSRRVAIFPRGAWLARWPTICRGLEDEPRIAPPKID